MPYVDPGDVIGSLGSGIANVGQGYIQGLLLKEKIDALKKEQKLNEMLAEAQVGHMTTQTQALREQMGQTAELFPFQKRMAETEATGAEETQAARSPALSALKTGGNLNRGQEALLFGKPITAEMDPVHSKIFELAQQGKIGWPEAAQITGRLNIEPKHPDMAMLDLIKDEKTNPELKSFVKGLLKEKYASMDALQRILLSNSLRSSENVRKEGVQSVEDIHKDFATSMRGLRLKAMEPAVDPKDISTERDRLTREYFDNLHQKHEKLPIGTVKEYVADLANRWRTEREALKSSKSSIPFLYGKGQKQIDTESAAMVSKYANLIGGLMGEDLGRDPAIAKAVTDALGPELTKQLIDSVNAGRK